MTRVEIHVFDPGSDTCVDSYITDMVRSRARYSTVSLCVDSTEQVLQWRTRLSPSLAQVEVFSTDADVPLIPFQGEILLTVCRKVSPLFSAFKQTIDIVADTESAREDGRRRYRFYKDRGYPLRHIKVQDQEAVV